MKNLIIIPFHDFKVSLKYGFRTRDAHLSEHFMQDKNINNIIVINRPTSIIEFLFRRKKILSIKNIIHKKNFTYIQKYAENVYIIDFLVFDFFKVIKDRHSWIPQVYSRKNIEKKIKESLLYLNITEYSIYMSSPFSVRLGNNLNPKVKILDAVDNFAKYQNWAYFRREIISLYEIAKKDYDYIFVNSQDTFNFLNVKIKSKLELIPNGVDVEFFNDISFVPSDLPVGKPIAGYAGKMQRMFNTKLMRNLALDNPDINFVILGIFLDKKWKRENWDIDLKGIQNIYYLGDRDYNTLPSYYNNFDICFIPYFIKNQHGGDPIKFYEYMACNKPIISSNIGNIQKYNDNRSIFICDSEKEFLDNFKDLTLRIPLDINYELPGGISWSSIANNMSSKLFK